MPNANQMMDALDMVGPGLGVRVHPDSNALAARLRHWAGAQVSIAVQQVQCTTVVSGLPLHGRERAGYKHIRDKLSQLRLTLRDAKSYGFEAARFAFATVLTLMENGTIVWGDGHHLSEAQHSALVARDL
jgi:hypothetical protein